MCRYFTFVFIKVHSSIYVLLSRGCLLSGCFLWLTKMCLSLFLCLSFVAWNGKASEMTGVAAFAVATMTGW